MPHLATLKMAWNNINNLDPDTFATLTKLNDLDLSNNLITRLDDHIFKNNNEITKLNLSGNSIRKLSVRLFEPFYKLRELDVSECELTTLLAHNNNYSDYSKYKIYETLRSFNVSANEIKDISSLDVKYFKNLHTLDITRNPLKCNEHFQDFIRFVSLSKMISPISSPVMASILNEATANMEALDAHRDWAKLARDTCKHQNVTNFKAKVIDIVTEHKEEEDLEKRLEDVDKAINDDDWYLLSVMEKRKYEEAQRILKGKQKSNVNHKHKPEFELVKDDNDEENESEYDDDDDDEETEEDDATYDEEDEYDTLNKKQNSKNYDEDRIIDHGVKVEEIDLHEETKDKFLLNKFLLNNDDKPVEHKENDDVDDNDDSNDEEIIIERGRIYYSGYNFLIPILVIVLGLLALMLIFAKLITMIMRKRGERYRMALLAASKNSIVYQKLTEDINAPIKESKQPKVHRYSPINQV